MRRRERADTYGRSKSSLGRDCTFRTRMRGVAGCAGAPPAAAVSAATTTTATSTAGAAYRRRCCCRRRRRRRRCLAGAAAAGGGSQRCPPRGSRHFLPDGSGVQARWTYDEPQPVAAAPLKERKD